MSRAEKKMCSHCDERVVYAAEKKMCSHCGERVVHAKGYCTRCYARVRRHGTPELEPGPKRDRTKKIIKMHIKGMNNCDIARELGVSRQWVSAAIKRYGRTNYDRIHVMSKASLCTFLTGIFSENDTDISELRETIEKWLDAPCEEEIA